MFDLQFLLDDDQPSTTNAAGPDALGIKAIARSLLGKPSVNNSDNW